jgi:hypothetical protein
MKIIQWWHRWWYGVPPSITMAEDASVFRLTYQDPNHPPARERVKAALTTPHAKAFLGFCGAVLVAVLAAAIAKLLRLT